jgi:hypothetical protein
VVATAVPWTRRDLTLWALLMLAAIALMLIAWNGASNELRFEDDLAWLQLAIAGVAIAALANVLFFLAARRRVRGLLVALLSSGSASVSPPPVLRSAPMRGAAGLVAAPTMTHFHRPGCQLAAAKPVAIASRSEHERAGRQPCGMCRP